VTFQGKTSTRVFYRGKTPGSQIPESHCENSLITGFSGRVPGLHALVKALFLQFLVSSPRIPGNSQDNSWDLPGQKH